jgi:hypothetical protein
MKKEKPKLDSYEIRQLAGHVKDWACEGKFIRPIPDEESDEDGRRRFESFFGVVGLVRICACASFAKEIGGRLVDGKFYVEAGVLGYTNSLGHYGASWTDSSEDAENVRTTYKLACERFMASIEERKRNAHLYTKKNIVATAIAEARRLIAGDKQ